MFESCRGRLFFSSRVILDRICGAGMIRAPRADKVANLLAPWCENRAGENVVVSPRGYYAPVKRHCRSGHYDWASILLSDAPVTYRNMCDVMIDSRTLFELAQRFQQPLPRYTSYPTAAELSEKFDYGDLERHLHDTFSQQLPTALYVHLPYCKSLCYFCACSKVISADQRARHEYLSFLEKECVRLTALGTPEVNELHLGGGSPSYLSVSELEQLEFCLRQYFPASDLRKSIELDPRTIDSEKIGFLVENGYERISIGVQDFDPVVQQLVNRIQPVEMLEHVLEDLRSRDVHQINFDLIYGLPGQTRESFEETIREVCRLRPSRIALYGYAHVPWKMKVQKTLQKYGLPSPTDRLHLFTQAAIELQTQGYKYIGLDHFALPDDELSLADANQTLRRNFMGYTTFRDLSLIHI